jgi:hypothetical protein
MRTRYTRRCCDGCQHSIVEGLRREYANMRALQALSLGSSVRYLPLLDRLCSDLPEPRWQSQRWHAWHSQQSQLPPCPLPALSAPPVHTLHERGTLPVPRGHSSQARTTQCAFGVFDLPLRHDVPRVSSAPRCISLAGIATA